MRKILFGLFIAISYMANAALPVVNDSVLVEAKEDDAYYDMFLKSLPDSVYDSPMVTRFFREVGGLGNIKISLIEHYSLNGKNKNHYLKFDISDAISSIGILMSYDDVKSIITILTDIYENTKELRLSGEKENISYKKLISSRSLFAVSLSYNPKKDRWNCQIDISIVDPTNYVGKSVIIYQDVDYKKHCRLKDFEKDMPKLVELLKQGLAEITDRKYNYKEPLFKKECRKGYNQYYFDYGDSLVLKLVAKENVNKDYSKEIFAKKYSHNINEVLNDIIKDYKVFDELSDYGILDLIIDENGNVSCVKLELSDRLSMGLSDKDIGLMLKKVKDYKFLPVSNKDKLNEVGYVNVRIPLSSNGNYRIIDLVEKGIICVPDSYKGPKLLSKKDGSGIQYLMDYGYGLWDKYVDVNTNTNYANQLVKERYTIDLNFKINGIIDNKYKKLKKIDSFGVVEVVIDESGQVVCSKLSLNKAVSDALDEKTIVKILANIDGYKFKKIEDGTDYVKVYIPLKGYPQY